MYSTSHSLPSVLTSVPPASSYNYDKLVESGNSIGMTKNTGSLYEYNSLQVVFLLNVKKLLYFYILMLMLSFFLSAG